MTGDIMMGGGGQHDKVLLQQMTNSDQWSNLKNNWNFVLEVDYKG